jgi:phosphate/sulfate permease
MWLMQDAANVAVFLPRSLEFSEFAVFAGVLFLGLAVLFKLGGDKIQEIVEEKAAVVDVRHATLIDATYAIILYIFKVISNIPMSTTWVFLGLLAGREIAINLTRAKEDRRPMREVGRLIAKDLLFVSFGLVVSVAIAAAVNPTIADKLLSW